MTTIEQFEQLYREATPAQRQRFDDIMTGVSIARETSNGPVSDHSQSDSRVLGDRETVKGDTK